MRLKLLIGDGIENDGATRAPEEFCGSGCPGRVAATTPPSAAAAGTYPCAKVRV